MNQGHSAVQWTPAQSEMSLLSSLVPTLHRHCAPRWFYPRVVALIKVLNRTRSFADKRGHSLPEPQMIVLGRHKPEMTSYGLSNIVSVLSQVAAEKTQNSEWKAPEKAEMPHVKNAGEVSWHRLWSWHCWGVCDLWSLLTYCSWRLGTMVTGLLKPSILSYATDLFPCTNPCKWSQGDSSSWSETSNQLHQKC